ncbi:phosphate ABC transporter substrate-binding protein [Sessilibacter sp. MAH4]
MSLVTRIFTQRAHSSQLSRLFCLLGVVSIAFLSNLSLAAERLTLTGSSTVAPLALEMAKRFEKNNPDVRIDVQTGGSSRGVNDARVGLADIGMVSRALKESEQDLTAHLIALDGIGIIVHSSNTVKELSRQQIIDIYQGKIRNWADVDGPNLEITVVNKAEGRSTLELFLHFFELKNSQIRPQVVIGDNQQGIKTVSGNPGAIGYVSIGTAEFEHNRGTPIKLLPMDGKEATVKGVASGEYPLSRPLNLVTKAQPEGFAASFIEFAQSTDVLDLIENQFFVAP